MSAGLTRYLQENAVYAAFFFTGVVWLLIMWIRAQRSRRARR